MPLYGLFIVVFGHVLLPYPFWAGALPAKGGCEQTHTHNRVNFRTCPRPRRCWCNLFCAAGVARDFLHLLCAAPPRLLLPPFRTPASPPLLVQTTRIIYSLPAPGKLIDVGKLQPSATHRHTHTQAHTHTHSGTWLSKYLWATRDNLPAHRSFYWFLIQIAGKLMGKFQQQL